MQYANMKSGKAQPTSYKDFLEQVDKAKTNKKANQFKVKGTPRMNNSNSIASPHSQSTCLWDKRSPSHSKRLATDLSSDKQTKSYNISQNQSHNQSTQLQTKSVKLSRKDKSLSYHKFITEATLKLTELFKIAIPELLNARVSYIEYLEALKSLKMIYESYEPYPSDLVSELWSECISGQNVGNFIITTCAILGLYENKQSEDDKYLKDKYESLRYTRMELNRGSQNDSYKENQYSFMPQISDRSRKLAASGSKSKLKSHDKYCALTDRTNGLADRYEKGKTSINPHQDQNFFGKTNELAIKSKTDLTGNIRSQILYQKAKEKSCEKRQNKSSNDIEYEKSRKELTFKPTILKVKTKEKEKIVEKCSVRGEKNTISRMIRGRVEREVRKIINEKGVPYNEKAVDKMRKQKYEQIASVSTFVSLDQSETGDSLETFKMFTPVIPKPAPVEVKQPSIPLPQQDIVIDVYLSEDHKEKLIVRKGQSLQQLAEAFIQKHGIGKEKKDQLVQLLQVSLNHALCPIDELVEEEDELASARTHCNKREYCR